MGSHKIAEASNGAAAFVDRVFESSLGTFDVFSIYLGDRLGLYAALHEHGPATARELAANSGIDARYAREWLEQQAASGIIEVDDVSADAEARRFELPEGHAEALLDPDSLNSIAPVARAIAAVGATLPQVLEAFRTGGGVDWSEYGSDGIESQGDFNRPWLRASLGTEYLPAIVDAHARLQADPPAKVADLACGVGWAGIAIAQAYPNVEVHGFDSDESSISLARKFAAEEGVATRTRFEVQDIAAEDLQGPYDLVIVVEAIHDLARPVEALATIRRILAPGGVAIVADERTAESFTAPADPSERLYNGFSVFMCLPAGMHEKPSAGTGTVMRPATFRSYALEAGFSDVEILDLEHDLLRFYKLNP